MDTKSAPQIFEHHKVSLALTPFDTKWLPNSAKCVLVGQSPRMTGVLKFYQLEQEGLRELLTVDELGPGLKCCTFNHFGSAQSPSLALGGSSGKLMLFDLEAQKVGFEVQAHSVMLNSLDSAGGAASPGPTELLTGGRDGCVRLWDTRQNAPVLVLEPADKASSPPDCWAVALGNCSSPEERCLVAGYDNGDLKMFDLRKNALVWSHNLKNGVCGLQFDRKDIAMNKLGVTTLEGKVHMFDLRTWHPELGFAGLVESTGNSTMWGLRHLPQNRDLCATLGGDGVLKLFKYNYPSQRWMEDADGKKKGVAGSLQLLNDHQIAQQPLVGFDWNTDKIGLGVSCALDQTLKVIITTKLNLY